MAKKKTVHSQLSPSPAMDAAGVPTARHALMAARKRQEVSPSRKNKAALIESEKEFLARVNLAKKRKVRKQ
jgi:hypothetical protein